MENTILIVDDVQDSRIILRKILSDQYQILEAKNEQTALELLDLYEEKISAVILDLNASAEAVFLFLKNYMGMAAYRDIPIIVTIIAGDEKNEKRFLEMGIWDLITKPFRPEIIQLRLKNVIARSQVYMAERDPLTGFYNKKKFFRATRQMIDEHPEIEFFLLRLDIDQFKLINTFFGLAEGDRLLQYIADVIRGMAKNMSLCTYGRIEADVFCLCKPCHEEPIEYLI